MSKIYGIPTVTPLVPGATGGGVDGKSAYELAVSEGYEGTLTEWLDSLVGPQGERGERGPQGATGATGADAPIDTYLPKDGSNPMTGDLSMGGNRITNLGTPVNEDDAVRKRDVRPAGWTPSALEVGARPDTWTPTAEEVGARPDTWTPTAEEVGARPNTWTPTFGDVGAAPAFESNSYRGSYYRMVGDEREWINPPMVLGEEYRTTERLDTLVVYTKIINFGEMPHNSSKTVQHVVDGSIFSVDGIVFNADGIPIVSFAANQSVSCDFAGSNVSVGTTWDFNNCTAYLIVKYYKR